MSGHVKTKETYSVGQQFTASERGKEENTVPFQSIRPVTRHRACGLALILVNVTCHVDFGRM